MPSEYVNSLIELSGDYSKALMKTSYKFEFKSFVRVSVLLACWSLQLRYGYVSGGKLNKTVGGFPSQVLPWLINKGYLVKTGKFHKPLRVSEQGKRVIGYFVRYCVKMEGKRVQDVK